MMKGKGMPPVLTRAAFLAGVLLRRGPMGERGLSSHSSAWLALESLAWQRWAS